MTNKYLVPFKDRIIASLSYLTVGWVGFIYVVVLFFLKKKLSHFLTYNIMQSVLIAFIYYVLCMVIGFVFNVLSHIPFVQILVSWVQLIFNRPVFFNYSLVQVVVFSLFIYMAFVTLRGRYPRIYGISRLIDR